MSLSHQLLPSRKIPGLSPGMNPEHLVPKQSDHKTSAVVSDRAAQGMGAEAHAAQSNNKIPIKQQNPLVNSFSLQ